MRRKLWLLLLPALLLGAAPASVSAGPSEQARSRHEAAVAFWTADRIRAAIPRDVIRDPVPDAAANPGKGKPPKPSPSPTPTPSPTPSPTPDPGAVTGASWTGGGAALTGTGRVFFALGVWLYSCSAGVVTDTRTNESLVLTAGHCVIDKGKFATLWLFIPEYDSDPVQYNDCGNSKYGCWSADALVVHSGFASQKTFNTTAVTHDFAFAVMGPGGHSGSASLETAVGGRFGIEFSGPDLGSTVAAFGYPAQGEYDGTDLTYCQGAIGEDSRIANATWRLRCDMTGGSSGGGWLTGTPTSFGAVLRSLNSYGYTGEDDMYGPKFNSTTEAVWKAANLATGNEIVSGG
jgi:hypothetical protein